MYTTIRMFALGSLVMVLSMPGAAKGDLYAHGVLTLDWLVDSSDEVHKVGLAESESAGGLVTESIEVLKPVSGKSELTEDGVGRFRPPLRGMDAGESLIFVRTTKDSLTRVVRWVNLDEPMAHYRSAAFTRDGTPLRDKEAILAAVKSRVRLGRQLPPRCDRFVVDVATRGGSDG